MDEKTAKYVKLFKTHLDRIVIGVMFCLLAVLGWLRMQEQTAATESAIEPRQPNLEDPVAKNPDYERIFAMTKPQEISKYELIDQVAKYNMFDYKSVKQKEALDREANQKFVQAQDAAGKGQTEEAKRLLKEILAVMPTHQKARELHDKLTAPAATPTPAAPAPGAVPPGGDPMAQMK